MGDKGEECTTRLYLLSCRHALLLFGLLWRLTNEGTRGVSFGRSSLRVIHNGTALLSSSPSCLEPAMPMPRGTLAQHYDCLSGYILSHAISLVTVMSVKGTLIYRANVKPTRLAGNSVDHRSINQKKSVSDPKNTRFHRRHIGYARADRGLLPTIPTVAPCHQCVSTCGTVI